MEADYGSDMPIKLVVPWKNDWEQFKRMFKASARLNGVADAIKAGEKIAKTRGHSNEESKAPDQEDIKEEEQLTKDPTASKQAAKLAAMLTLSLGDTVGVQQSIVTDVLEEDEDGIEAWAALVTHFEYSTEDIKAEALFHKWEEERLLQGEHPDVLWARLSSIQRKLAKIGEGCSEKNVIRRFISAIEKQPGNSYNEVLAAYRGQLIKGKPFTSTELREFLSITHKKNNLNDNEKDRYQGATAMKGFITKEAKKCNHCRKPGHEK